MFSSEEIRAEDGSLSSLRRNLETGELYDPGYGFRAVPGVPEGAVPTVPGPTEIKIQDTQGNPMPEDLRVKIRVPSKYLRSSTKGLANELQDLGGIIFPYTPSINFEAKADYSSQSPLHSNFAINFYQKSSIGSISVSGKFTVQTTKDAAVYLATVHLLTALTRMRSGGTTGDPDSGAPPPVCRLDAHGMFVNVPVAITNFRIELPDNVDYFAIPDYGIYAATSVPVVSNISISCLPMYSRNEMQNFSVSGYLNEARNYKSRGFI